MDLEVSIKDLQKRGIFFATPMYGGNCNGFFTKSCTDLASMKSHCSFSICSMNR
jgi:hypothetical protein